MSINLNYDQQIKSRYNRFNHSKSSSGQFNIPNWEYKNSKVINFNFGQSTSNKSDLKLVWWGKNNQATVKSKPLNTPLNTKQTKIKTSDIDLISSSFISKVGVIKGLSNYNTYGERPSKFVLKYFK